MSYYSRQNVVNLDGSGMFQTGEDCDNERQVADVVESAWKCNLRQFGALTPIDWFAERHGRLVGLVELKSRAHPSGKFPTVFLNVRKWLALLLGANGLGCPALFIVKFSDGIKWIRIADVDARQHQIGGCTKFVKSKSDIEPIIHVRISDMRELRAP